VKVNCSFGFADGLLKSRSRRKEALTSKSGIGNRKSEINLSLVTSSSTNSFAFTIVELLVVISILGILAALTVPALKNIGKSDSTISASRQLLDGVGRARQLAMANHTTVYMIFCPTNFWMDNGSSFQNPWWAKLTPAQQTAATNLCDKQLTGYTFVGRGTVGDQPGNHVWHYLAPWQNLPDGTFIAQQKFIEQPNQFFPINDPVSGAVFNIYGFNVTNTIPFPTEDEVKNDPFPPPRMPYIAFNYLGQLTSDGKNLAIRDEYIPLAQGSVSPAINATTKALQFNSPQVSENPPGNSTNISYNIVHIDALTGRATLEQHKI
jgi:prepilin-type N-terminal cleavage/methylation domain-containing protein